MKAVLAFAAAAVIAVAGAAAAQPKFSMRALGQPLKVGATAPDFTVVTTTGGQHKTFRLKDQLNKTSVVLYFYPAAFTGGCTIEANEFARAVGDFKKKGALVVGVSTDPVAVLDDFSKKECQSAFPLAADTDAKVADAYGVKTEFTVDGKTRILANRTSYVIGKNGKVKLVHADNADARSHITKTLAALD